MNRPNYDRRKVRRAMLIAPAAGLLGLLPYLFLLNLTSAQLLFATVAALVACYFAGLLLGAPGYFVLRGLGYSQTMYLMSYAALLVIVTALLFGDIYVLTSLGPPVLLAAGAFCLLRGSATEKSDDALRSD